jgi:hypothetical protein
MDTIMRIKIIIINSVIILKYDNNNNNNNNHGSTALYGPGPPLASSFRGY